MERTSAVDFKLSCTNEYLLALLRAGLNDTQPPEKPEAVSWNALFAAAKRQSVAALTFSAIQRLQTRPTGDEYALWDEWNIKLLAKCVNQNIEGEKLLNALNDAGIRAMPLKGYYIRQLYPRAELREMGDIDLLVDDDRSEQMQAFMKQLGYRVGIDIIHEVEYIKLPYLLIELHRRLLPEENSSIAYMRTPWVFSEPDDPARPLIRKPTATALYVYHILHFYKHYTKVGCGIRAVLDLFVLLRSCAGQINWDEAAKQLCDQEIKAFAQLVTALAETWFADGTYDEAQQVLARRLLRNATYGSKEQYEANCIAALAGKKKNIAAGKRRFFLRIVFPPKKDMLLCYPCLERAGFLLPLFWLVRGVRTVLKNPKHIKKHYERIMKTEI